MIVRAEAASREFGIGVDIGGTFTDLVVTHGAEVKGSWKAATTRDRQIVGVLSALQQAAVELNLTRRGLLEGCSSFIIGTTATTNAILTRRGSEVALVTTRGFGDHYHMARQRRLDTIDVSQIRHPEALLQRSQVSEITERTDYKGRCLCPVDATEIGNEARRLVGAGATAVAVSFLWSTANSENEAAAVRAIRGEFPDLAVFGGAGTARTQGEYERTSTAVLSAYIGPTLAAVLADAESELQVAGLVCPLRVMRSDGTIGSVDDVLRQPATTVFSGPAGGIAAAASIAIEGHLPVAVTLDVGGTSTEVGFLVNGKARTTSTHEIAGHPLAGTALIDVEPWGSGGGSVVWRGPTGEMRVGPNSAGALPGPACYDRGGIEFTLTDAYLLLGYLADGQQLGDAVALRQELAYRAAKDLSENFDLEPHEAARGAFEIANHAMATAVRVRTIQRGLDPRGATLIAFGGAGGIHAPFVAQAMGIDRVVVPVIGGSLSALGLMTAPVSHSRTIPGNIIVQAGGDVAGAEIDRLARDVRQAGAEVSNALLGDGIPATEQTIDSTAFFSYDGQSISIDVPLASVDISENDLPGLLELFRDRYADRFSAAALSTTSPHVLKSISVVGQGTSHAFSRRPPPGAASGAVGTRSERLTALGVDLDLVTTTCHGPSVLDDPGVIPGPAVVELPGITIVIPTGWESSASGSGAVIVTRSPTTSKAAQ